MPPVVVRLAGEYNFRNVYRRGRRLRGQFISLSYIKVPASPTRVAVVVSRQVSNRATKRNLYKRRLWSGIREHQAQLPRQNYHLVITAQPKIRALIYQEISDELGEFIKKLPQA